MDGSPPVNELCSIQVAGNFTLPWNAAHANVERLVGHTKAKDSIPVRSLLEAGATVTLSSDWDVSSPNPFIGMSHAVNRGAQSVDLKVAKNFVRKST